MTSWWLKRILWTDWFIIKIKFGLRFPVWFRHTISWSYRARRLLNHEGSQAAGSRAGGDFILQHQWLKLHVSSNRDSVKKKNKQEWQAVFGWLNFAAFFRGFVPLAAKSGAFQQSRRLEVKTGAYIKAWAAYWDWAGFRLKAERNV